jgi:hypothetical protein
MPLLTEDILPGREAIVHSLEAIIDPQNEYESADPSVLEVVALVESKRIAGTGLFMLELAKLAKKGFEIQVWDWRVLDDGDVKKWFWAWVRDGVVEWNHGGGRSTFR